ncbi:hypothetical protein FNL55_05345 [Tardiphaga sp. vice352]|uniref:hypothetical protein n=1 Tax=Tardiphaga sp. vice352 TaxID=2592816 RepID=UPI001164C194|nr:hypothetical protein [Tardiphaga sp. vice352]QDM30824.1 hypothetical protein FNL55_05345 [Tardiphaga sp. vice352]
MIKINSVGNKLGLAGLLGIVLSVGVVANQIRTEAAITQANRHADVQQTIADYARKVESELGNMRLANRAVRMAITTKEIEKSEIDRGAAKAAQDKSVDAALVLAVKPERLTEKEAE